jgi:hypothetical protein
MRVRFVSDALARACALRGSSFPSPLSNDGRLRTRYQFALRQSLGNLGHAPLDSSDNGEIGQTGWRKGDEAILAAETINQLLLAWPENQVREREEVSERPHQQCALNEVGLQVSRPDRRIQFKDAVGEFFHPHYQAYLNQESNKCPRIRAGYYCTNFGAWEESFCACRKISSRVPKFRWQARPVFPQSYRFHFRLVPFP